MKDSEARHAIKEIAQRQIHLYKMINNEYVGNEWEGDPFLRDCKILDKIMNDE